MPAQKTEEQLLKEAPFVFRGVVTRTKASTVEQVAPSDRTVVVRVLSIVHAPRSLSHCGGKEITVLLSGDTKPAADAELMFFATEWMFGKGVAVASLGELPVAEARQTLATAGVDPVRTLAHRKLEKRVDEADLVISGTVKSVHVVDPPEGGMSPLTASEHNPHWREAVVEVHQVHKGDGQPKTVVVRFPASRDMMWNKAPKFRAGQEGHFVLQKASATAGLAPAAAVKAAAAPGGAAAGEQVYTAMAPEDFQPLAQPGGLKPLLNIPE